MIDEFTSEDTTELADLQEEMLIEVLELLKTVRFWHDKGLQPAVITEMLIKIMNEEHLFTSTGETEIYLSTMKAWRDR